MSLLELSPSSMALVANGEITPAGYAHIRTGLETWSTAKLQSVRRQTQFIITEGWHHPQVRELLKAVKARHGAIYASGAFKPLVFWARAAIDKILLERSRAEVATTCPAL